MAYSLDCHKGMLPIDSYYSPWHFPLFHPKGEIGRGEEKEKKKKKQMVGPSPFPSPLTLPLLQLPGPPIPTHPPPSLSPSLIIFSKYICTAVRNAEIVSILTSGSNMY